MKKRFYVLFFTVMVFVFSAFGLAACDGKYEKVIADLTVNANGELIVTYSDSSTANLGKVGGDTVGIKNFAVDDGGNLIVTFTDNTTADLGQVRGSDGKDGVGIKGVSLNASGELIVTYTNGSYANLGQVGGASGNVVGIKNVAINANGELVVTYTNNTTANLGQVRGANGNNGVGIKNVEIDTDGSMIITYTDDRTVNLGTVVACKHLRLSDWIVLYQPDCVTTGWATKQCLDCTYSVFRPIEALGHTFDSTYSVAEPTCQKGGLDIRICGVCGATEAEISDPGDHKFEQGVCVYCGLEQYSEMLKYEEIKNADGEVIAYRVGKMFGDTHERIVIPATYNGKPVTEIKSGAFADCHYLKIVTIGKNITTIGESAFYDCPELQVVYWNATACSYAGSIDCTIFIDYWEDKYIRNIYIGENVTMIPDYAFEYCHGVVELVVPSSVQSIGKNAFCNMVSMRSIRYGGTKAEWGAITKGRYWNLYVRNCVVHCSDGDIELEDGVYGG